MEENFQEQYAKRTEQKKHSALSKQEKAREDSNIVEELENNITRLRVLNERYTNLQTELKVIEENMIKKNKKLIIDIKTLTSDLNEMKKEINEIKDTVLRIIKEFQGFAKKEDVRVLEKYIEMWEPVNFVTHKEIDDIINEKLAGKDKFINTNYQ